jgi:hypothetical protein
LAKLNTDLLRVTYFHETPNKSLKAQVGSNDSYYKTNAALGCLETTVAILRILGPLLVESNIES